MECCIKISISSPITDWAYIINLTNQQFLYNPKRHLVFQIAHSLSTLSPSLRCTHLLKCSPLHSPPGPRLERWLRTPLGSRISCDHQLQKYMDAIASTYWHIRINILPEWGAFGFSKIEHVIKNGFKALPAKYFLHVDIRARKRICWHRIKIIISFPNGDFSLAHLMKINQGNVRHNTTSFIRC